MAVYLGNEMVSSGGGIGGDSTGGGVFIVTINGKTKDKTFEEINNAYKKGLTVKVRRATSDGMYQIMDLTICQEDSTYYFSGVMFTGSNVTILGVAIFNDDSFAPMDKTL